MRVCCNGLHGRRRNGLITGKDTGPSMIFVDVTLTGQGGYDPQGEREHTVRTPTADDPNAALTVRHHFCSTGKPPATAW